MELIASINSAINGFVWGVPMLVLLVGGGILLTIRNRGVQFRKFGYAMKNTIGKIFKKGEAKGRRNYSLPGDEYGAGRHGGHR